MTASNDVRIPAGEGRRFAMRLKDRLRPLASALPQFSGLPSWPRTMAVLKHPSRSRMLRSFLDQG